MVDPPTEPAEELDALAAVIVDAIGEVRRELGAGLLEDPYVEALCIELKARGVRFVRAPAIPTSYKGHFLRRMAFPDLLVEDKIVVEAKAVAELLPVHHSQILTYLHHARLPLGFLVNFNAIPLRAGIHRKVNGRIRM